MGKRKSSMQTHERYIKRALRKIWGWHSERRKALKRAYLFTKHGMEYYRCEECGEEPIARRDKEVDHIVEVESLGEWDGDWTAYINRLFCPAEGLAIVCKPCHRKKTTANGAIRRKARKAS